VRIPHRSQQAPGVVGDLIGQPAQIVDHAHQRAAAGGQRDRPVVGAEEGVIKRVHRLGGFAPRHHGRTPCARGTRVQPAVVRLEGAGSEREATKTMNALYDTFLGADYRPVALTAGSRALVRVVDDLGWLSDQITDDTGRLLGAMRDPALRVVAGLGGGAAAAQRRRASGA